MWSSDENFWDMAMWLHAGHAATNLKAGDPVCDMWLLKENRGVEGAADDWFSRPDSL